MHSLVEVSGAGESLIDLDFSPATRDMLLSVHTRRHVDSIEQQSCQSGGDAGDGSSPFGRGSFEIAQMAAGATTAALTAVLQDRVDNAYALVRPPGHHAERDTGRGFCIFSNVAIAIEEARRLRLAQRFAIVDIDVHHGNGAQSIYWDDPNVLTISLHQDRLFPLDSGMVDEVGSSDSDYTNINVPLPAGCGNGAYKAALDRCVAPAVESFQPDVIIVSCGFDASSADPLGRMCVSAGGYAEITERLIALANETCDGKIVFSHEGGYSPMYVPFCGLAVIESLAGFTARTPDPYSWAFDEYPVHDLTADQDKAIQAVVDARSQVTGHGG
ncbi:class II histone deacetylase [Nesterenkonia sp. LY-0111]|uniref:Class II histone deacetylase n=2 Tax=Nesterenkonia aerolata TaxID=3074079 RepID=A0ABU2DPL8_9MICC|nr:class II histone deacetylase [Nesterenkonia sp. LY-0111]MDR8018448.1 class II histone deacetylase [Nesterenkonia sp. LY-0111]